MTTAGSDVEQFTTTGWPWRTGNAFRLLDGGAEFFPRMLAAIDARAPPGAAGDVPGALGRHRHAVHRGAHRGRAARGARLRGVRRVRRAATWRARTGAACSTAAWSCASSIRCASRTGSATCCAITASCWCATTHVAFVGGAGLTDDFAPGGRRGPWREVMVQIEGRVVERLATRLRAHLAPLRRGAGAAGRRRRHTPAAARPDACRCRRRGSARCWPTAWCAASTPPSAVPGS